MRGVPTTLSGAEMTPSTAPRPAPRARARAPGARRGRPWADGLGPGTRLAATAMNALAHAMEALYTPLANPVAELAALRAAELLATGVRATRRTPRRWPWARCSRATRPAPPESPSPRDLPDDRPRGGTPHAETNAVMLPHSARLMAGRAPAELGLFARAVGDPDPNPDAAAGRVAKLAARCGHTRLLTLGVEESQRAGGRRGRAASAAGEHPLSAGREGADRPVAAGARPAGRLPVAHRVCRP